ncbi:hypothetical protein CgunFtcFv8_018887 [Champsocephalus gunnari]|uniref:Uncharacterized protein n=1 Tax=Champsocephalus gunnari TaxID=52237 RepID=A0AAN8HM52_CHAGU|nr:hypothetical protein CgunFtcFv8_018887 [Champsocephalus gunnari]
MSSLPLISSSGCLLDPRFVLPPPSHSSFSQLFCRFTSLTSPLSDSPISSSACLPHPPSLLRSPLLACRPPSSWLLMLRSAPPPSRSLSDHALSHRPPPYLNPVPLLCSSQLPPPASPPPFRVPLPDSCLVLPLLLASSRGHRGKDSLQAGSPPSLLKPYSNSSSLLSLSLVFFCFRLTPSSPTSWASLLSSLYLLGLPPRCTLPPSAWPFQFRPPPFSSNPASLNRSSIPFLRSPGRPLISSPRLIDTGNPHPRSSPSSNLLAPND